MAALHNFRVICIDAATGGSPPSITFGKTYVVSEWGEMSYRLVNDNREVGFYDKSRFQSLSEYRNSTIDFILEK